MHFEDLLEAKELDDGEVDVVTEPQAALVGADGGVVLNTIATVYLNLALIIYPRHTEDDDALWLNQAANDVLLLQTGIHLHHGNQCFKNLIDGLQILGLLAVTGTELFIDTV